MFWMICLVDLWQLVFTELCVKLGGHRDSCIADMASHRTDGKTDRWTDRADDYIWQGIMNALAKI